jgi:hypothetical protein
LQSIYEAYSSASSQIKSTETIEESLRENEILKLENSIVILRSKNNILTIEKKELEIKNSKLTTQVSQLLAERENLQSLLSTQQERTTKEYKLKIEDLQNKVFQYSNEIADLQKELLLKDEKITQIEQNSEDVTSSYFALLQRVQSMEERYEMLIKTFGLSNSVPQQNPPPSPSPHASQKQTPSKSPQTISTQERSPSRRNDSPLPWKHGKVNNIEEAQTITEVVKRNTLGRETSMPNLSYHQKNNRW